MSVAALQIIFLVSGPWKLNVVLEKSLKNGCNFLYEPCNKYAQHPGWDQVEFLRGKL